jgi:hypothetical protein
MTPIEITLSRLHKVKKTGKGWMACCPAHPDKSPSLSITEGTDSRLLLHCFAGCEYRDIMTAIGLTQQDGFSEGLTNSARLDYLLQSARAALQMQEVIINIGGNPENLQTDEDVATLAAAFKAKAVLTEEISKLQAKPAALPPPLVPVDLSDVMQARLENVGFCVKPWFPNRQVTLFGGHGGIGKSTLALAVAAHVAAGLSFAGMEVTQTPVLFVSLEDEPMIVRLRLRRVIEVYNLPADAVLANMRLLDGTQGMAALMTGGDGFNSEPQFTLVYRDLLSQSDGAGLVIIDNASDAFEANENARRDVRLFMRGLVRIARENDAAVVLLAHIDKLSAKAGSQGNSYSGSTAWHNSARSRIALINEDGGVSVLHEKANLSACADPLPININEHGIPMPARSGGTLEAGGMTPEEMDQAEMLRAMKAAAETGINAPANVAPGAHSAMNALGNLPEYSAAFKRGRQGKSRASSALTAMLRYGVIITDTYRKANRHSADRFILSSQRTDATAPQEEIKSALRHPLIPPSASTRPKEHASAALTMNNAASV